MVEKLKCQLPPIKNIEEYDLNVLCTNFGAFYQMSKCITPPSLTTEIVLEFYTNILQLLGVSEWSVGIVTCHHMLQV